MQLAQLSSVALLLALIPFATFQTPATDPTPPAPKQDKGDRPKTKTAPEEAAERVRNDLLGAWKLERFDMDGEIFTSGTCRGYLLVTGEYLSLDLQVESKYVHNLDNHGQLFSSGVQRWKYEQSRLMLTTSSLIGVGNFTPEEIVLYERTGTPREYRVSFVEDTLTLERTPTSRMLFRRMGKPTPPPVVEAPEKK